MSGNNGDRDDPTSNNRTTGGGSQAGGAGGGGTGGGSSDPCHIVMPAPLNSPKPAVVAKLSLNQELRIHLNQAGARPILEVRTAEGDVAGSLTHVGHLSLINCMQQDRSYRAIVLSVSGGAVMVRIEPA